MILNKKVGVLLNLVHFGFKQHIAECLKKAGYAITPEQFLVLDAIWDYDKGISQQQIANRVRKDKNSVCKLVDGLQKKGLVERIPDPEDRRVNLIRITPLAATISEGVQNTAKSAVDTLIADIPEKDLNIFLDVLNRISDNLNGNRNILE